jgi:hypothetical protein
MVLPLRVRRAVLALVLKQKHNETDVSCSRIQNTRVGMLYPRSLRQIFECNREAIRLKHST